MIGWLEPVRLALEARPHPLNVFVRDDDVGWSDAALFRLLDVFQECAVPIDLAVIPRAATRALLERVAARRQRIDLHQHGYAHVNHEPEGSRKCEFGVARSRAEQHADIAHGHALLTAILGDRLQPMFTPPWNRCTVATAECLVELGFAALSRDATADLLSVPGLMELPINFDFFARRKGHPLSWLERGQLLAARLTSEEYVGIMLHHAVMSAEDFTQLREVLRLLAKHRHVRLSSMAELITSRDLLGLPRDLRSQPIS